MLDNAVKITISRPMAKGSTAAKLSGRQIMLKNVTCFQFETLRDKKAFHENIPLADLPAFFADKMTLYKQADIWYADGSHSVVFSKGRGELRLHKTKDKIRPQIAAAHDNEKDYIFKEGVDIPILRELGIFTPDFRVVKGMHSKFRQINNFIEIVDAAVKQADLPDVLRIVDFGCGNSYLTFAIYHYFTQIKQIAVDITGVDLQDDLIASCNTLAARFGYSNLRFECANIKDYQPPMPPHVVVSLHGCNTATDYAIANGIKWEAALMFVAPCCQHEINEQMKRQDLGELYAPLKYGVLKDRFAALLTDGLRANVLEMHDYKVDIAEFVGFNHSPKNILIRATKSAHDTHYKQLLRQQTEQLTTDLNINPTLQSLVSRL